MRVEPKTEAEIQAMNLRDPGEYDFLIVDAAEKLSQKGNEMIELKAQLEGADGRNFTVFDYLVSTDAMAYKVRHFAKAVGLLAEYEKGELQAIHCEGRTGKCKLAVQPAKGQYQAKNIIADYIPAETDDVPAKQLNDDEVPW